MDALTGSKLPRAEQCPASFALPAIVEAGGKYAEAGNEIHEQLYEIASGGDGPAWLVALFAELVGEDVYAPDGAPHPTKASVYAERCFAWHPATRKGRDLGTHGRDYAGLREGEIPCTVDLFVKYTDGAGAVYDYKSGFLGASVDSAQLSHQALACMSAFGLESIMLGIVKIDAEQQTWSVRSKTMDVLDASAEEARIVKILDRVKTARATPLEHLDVHPTDDACRYCPCWQSCPAKTKAIATVYGLVGIAKPEAAITVTAENAGAVWAAVKAMEKVLAKAKSDAESFALRGFVPLPDGRVLKAVEQSRESMADVDGIQFVLAEMYGEEAASAAVEEKRSITKGAIEALAKSRAEKGKGVGEARRALSVLRDRGLVRESSFLQFKAVEEKEGLPMADGLNRVMLLGNLGADPELRSTNGGESVLRLRLATSEKYLDRDKNWQERTEWHSVTVWGKRAEALHRILSKGSTLFVEGSLRTSSYDDKDGVKRYKTEVNAKEIILTGGRPSGGGDSAGQTGGYQRSGTRSDGKPRGDFGDDSAPDNFDETGIPF